MVNGSISFISAEYTLDGEENDEKMSFKYYNIGTSVMEIPQSVIDGAVKEDSKKEDLPDEELPEEIESENYPLS